MKLVDLNPMLEPVGYGLRRLSFDCPSCPETHRIAVDTCTTGILARNKHNKHAWQIFRFPGSWDLTLSPSINWEPCGWHGFVTRGVVTPSKEAQP